MEVEVESQVSPRTVTSPGAGGGSSTTAGSTQRVTTTRTHETSYRGSSRVGSLESDLLDQLAAKNRLLEEKEEYISQQHARLTSNMESLRDSMTNTLRDKDHSLAEQERLLQQYLSQIQDLQATESLAEQHRRNLRDVQERLQTSEEERMRRERELREEREEQLSIQREKYNSMLEGMRDTHLHSTREKEGAIQSLEGQLQSKHDMIQRLQAEVGDLKKEIWGLKDKELSIANLQRQLDQQDSVVESMQCSLEGSEERLKRALAENRDLRHRLAVAEEEATEHKRLSELYKQSNPEMESRIHTLQSEKAELTRRMSTVSGKEGFLRQLLLLNFEESLRRQNLMASALDSLANKRLEVLATVHEITVRQYRSWLKIARDESKTQKMYPYLGLEIAEELDRDLFNGVKVSMIRHNSPAEVADVCTDDVIQSVQVVHKSTVRDLHDFRSAMAKVRPSDCVTLEIVRGDVRVFKEIMVQGTEVDQHRLPQRRKVARSPGNSPTIIGPPP